MNAVMRANHKLSSAYQILGQNVTALLCDKGVGRKTPIHFLMLGILRPESTMVFFFLLQKPAHDLIKVP